MNKVTQRPHTYRNAFPRLTGSTQTTHHFLPLIKTQSPFFLGPTSNSAYELPEIISKKILFFHFHSRAT